MFAKSILQPTFPFKQIVLKPTSLARSFVSTHVFQFQEKDERHKGDHYCLVPNRSLIELDGHDTAKFLQGLITNHMPKISPGGDGFYTAFLTPSGRMLYDTFIYPVNVGVNFPHPKFLIECPTSSKQELIKHLRRYLLRSKIKIRDCSDEYKLWQIWGPSLRSFSDPKLVKERVRISDIGCHDPRIQGFGYRAILKAEQEVQTVLPQPTAGNFEELDRSEYTIRRILHGLPEGPDDIWPEASLPLESNFDYMNGGIDFRKGCYVGQELTIRTYHTGVVRKLQSVDRSKDVPSVLLPQTEIKLVDGMSKKSVGKMGSGIHNIGLALMRLEHVQKSITDPTVLFKIPENESIRIKPFLPEWWSVEETENKNNISI
ncbi:uncharacterized protein BX663DRAFT_551830 [Cokeromyces recurvatus]|uniref:uncharacterized protein n=1 Tax=Cokeromyces recurvatus TaxID=90255 RepID=UPI0022204A97|nr:uncharacterized protein BX663DRAFT_551830 [Cokeromyces recurvatus]KAI7902968.1 hypothetical protein BX663DRAFT_551830 [Cokeromyces recurvatus]